MVAGTQLSLCVSTGGRDTVVRQVQWSAAVQTPVNYHYQLHEHPIGDVKPMKLVVQYLLTTVLMMFHHMSKYFYEIVIV